MNRYEADAISALNEANDWLSRNPRSPRVLLITRLRDTLREVAAHGTAGVTPTPEAVVIEADEWLDNTRHTETWRTAFRLRNTLVRVIDARNNANRTVQP